MPFRHAGKQQSAEPHSKPPRRRLRLNVGCVRRRSRGGTPADCKCSVACCSCVWHKGPAAEAATMSRKPDAGCTGQSADTSSAAFHTLPGSTAPHLHTAMSGAAPFAEPFVAAPAGLRPISTRPGSTSGPASSGGSQSMTVQLQSASRVTHLFPHTRHAAAQSDCEHEQKSWGERFAQLFGRQQGRAEVPVLQSVEYPLQTCDSPLHEPVYACSPRSLLLSQRRKHTAAPGHASLSLDALADSMAPRRTLSGMSQAHSVGRLGAHSLLGTAAAQGGSARSSTKHRARGSRLGAAATIASSAGGGSGRSSSHTGGADCSERMPFGRAPVEPQGIAVPDADWLRCTDSTIVRPNARGSGDLAAQSELSMASTVAGRPFLPLPPPMASDGQLCMDAQGNFVAHFPARRLADAPASAIGPSAA